jgi:hypothetical protein
MAQVLASVQGTAEEERLRLLHTFAAQQAAGRGRANVKAPSARQVAY